MFSQRQDATQMLALADTPPSDDFPLAFVADEYQTVTNCQQSLTTIQNNRDKVRGSFCNEQIQFQCCQR